MISIDVLVRESVLPGDREGGVEEMNWKLRRLLRPDGHFCHQFLLRRVGEFIPANDKGR